MDTEDTAVHKLREILVQDNQQILKAVVSVFIILIKLPRHVSAYSCHLQGVTRSL
jgi:hypothetical protein